MSMSIELQERAKRLLHTIATFTEELYDSPKSLQKNLNDGLPEIKSFLGDCAVESIKSLQRKEDYKTNINRYTKRTTIQEMCSIVGLAYHSIGEYNYPSDCFCSEKNISEEHYQNAGQAIEYVRQAVLNQLKLDGYSIAKEFDSITGKEIK